MGERQWTKEQEQCIYADGGTLLVVTFTLAAEMKQRISAFTWNEKGGGLTLPAETPLSAR